MNEMIFNTLSTMPATGDNFPFATVGIIGGIAVVALVVMSVISKNKK